MDDKLKKAFIYGCFFTIFGSVLVSVFTMYGKKLLDM